MENHLGKSSSKMVNDKIDKVCATFADVINSEFKKWLDVMKFELKIVTSASQLAVLTPVLNVS